MYLNKKNFFETMNKSGEVGIEQFTLFMIENYFSKGLTLDDYLDDYISQTHAYKDIASSVRSTFRDEAIKDLKIYFEQRKKGCLSWEEEIRAGKGRITADELDAM